MSLDVYNPLVTHRFDTVIYGGVLAATLLSAGESYSTDDTLRTCHSIAGC